MSDKHVMLSYQWDTQSLVEKVYEAIRAQGLKAWMDIHGGIKGNINDSMAKGVDNAAVVCCFMTSKYSESKNCKKELNYADAENVPVVPVMCEKDFKAKGWLGIITAGALWIDFRNPACFNKSVESLANEVVQAAEVDVSITEAEQKKAVAKAPDAPKTIVKKKPGRAFRHKIMGTFLAESGQVKFHQASGNRSTLVLRDIPEDTSYWVEEKGSKESNIVFYKNYATNGYLGFDPNGNYIYTKGQHYGAEEWILKADEHSSNGERAVVLFANYGKKYLAIRDGKLTGVNAYSEDCVWILA